MPASPTVPWRRLRHDAQRERVAVGVAARRARSATGASTAVATRRVGHDRGAVRVRIVARSGRGGRRSSRSGSRARTASCRSSSAERAVALRARQHGAAVVGAVAGAALRRRRPSSATSWWSLHPGLADRVHAVRAAADGRRLRCAWQARALDEHAGVALERDALDVVVARASAGNSACVEPWQASHCEAAVAASRSGTARGPAAGVSGLVAKVASTACAHVARARRTPTCSGSGRCCCVAVPVWQLWQVGSSSQPMRVGAPTALIVPWQLWHCIASVPSAATAAPIAPRRQRVAEPGWQR